MRWKLVCHSKPLQTLECVLISRFFPFLFSIIRLLGIDTIYLDSSARSAMLLVYVIGSIHVQSLSYTVCSLYKVYNATSTFLRPLDDDKLVV